MGTPRGRKLSLDHRQKISEGLKRKVSTGWNPMTQACIDGTKGCTRSDEHKKILSEKAKARKGIPQNMETVTGAHEDNINAKDWVITSPGGEVFKCRNLSHFIRMNESLFLDDDTIWKKGNCRASQGLRSLRLIDKKTKLPIYTHWKHWTIGENPITEY